MLRRGRRKRIDGPLRQRGDRKGSKPRRKGMTPLRFWARRARRDRSDREAPRGRVGRMVRPWGRRTGPLPRAAPVGCRGRSSRHRRCPGMSRPAMPIRPPRRRLRECSRALRKLHAFARPPGFRGRLLPSRQAMARAIRRRHFRWHFSAAEATARLHKSANSQSKRRQLAKVGLHAVSFLKREKPQGRRHRSCRSGGAIGGLARRILVGTFA